MPSSTTLQHAIENITIWRKGEQRAPHKPLLLLYVLSQYQRGHARMFDYASEIRDELHSLLERFGPQRRQYRPDMPFWRLKGDGFWELHNSEQCSTQGSRQPPGKELELCHVAGGFDEPHFALLNRNKKLINTLAHQILEAHFRRVFRKNWLKRWGLICSRSVKSATRIFASRCCAPITMSARSAASICAMIIPPSPWKRPISNGSSTAALRNP
jgi:putative restriction endonuclease